MALTLFKPVQPVKQATSSGGLSLYKQQTTPTPVTPTPTPTIDFKNSLSNINNPQSPYYQAPKPSVLPTTGLGAPIGRLLQKIPSPNLGTRGKDIFKSTETETKIVDFLSNMPSAILNSWGKSLETLSTPDGRTKLKEDAKRLPQTAQEVKDHLSKKEWGQAMQTAFDNSAVSVGMDVADFIPITWLGKAGLKGINASLRKTGQQIVKEGLEEAGFKTVKEVFEPVKVPEVPKAEVKPVTSGLKGGGGKLQPLAEEARGKITLYHGSNKTLSKDKLDYGTFFTQSEQEAIDYANMRSGGRGGKPVISKFEFDPSEVRLNQGTGEYQFIGKTKNLSGGKYPEQVYKALNDVWGTNMTKKEIDAMPFNEVRDNASQGFAGGRDEFDKLVSSPLEGAKVAPKVEPSITTQKVDTLKDAAQIKKAINKTSQEIHQLTNELQGKAEANKMRIEGLNMQNLAQLKNIVARSEKFQIGDVETIRASKTGQLMDKVLENIRENNPQFEDLYDDELLKLALSMPSKGETVFRKTPEIKQLEERAKTLQTYFKALENKYKSLTDKEKEVIFKDWQDAVIAQENLEKVIGVRKGFLPVGEEELKLSRLEARITQQLDEAPEEVKNLSTFNQMNKKDQIAQAVAYVSNHTDEALRILTGEKEPPEGILRNSVYVAMQNLAKGDVELARKLSSLTSTRFGQEISILTEIDPYSPVNIARDIFKIKEEVFKKRFGGREPGEVIKNLADKGKNDIKPPSKLEWGSLISEIRCK